MNYVCKTIYLYLSVVISVYDTIDVLNGQFKDELLISTVSKMLDLTSGCHQSLIKPDYYIIEQLKDTKIVK